MIKHAQARKKVYVQLGNIFGTVYLTYKEPTLVSPNGVPVWAFCFVKTEPLVITKRTYSITAEAGANIEYAKIALEEKQIYLRPNAQRTKYSSGEREIEVDMQVHAFFK